MINSFLNKKNVYHLKIFLSILAILSFTRFIPHPPNFTSLIALAFYIPIFLGISYLPLLVICFVLTDLIIGFHSLTLFTWGSIIFIGLLSKSFKKNMFYRIGGTIFSCIIFFIVTNFGVWMFGNYDFTFNGLILCYFLAIPFFGNTILSSLICSVFMEIIYKYFFKNKNFKTAIFSHYN